jgi:hypothetical protein
VESEFISFYGTKTPSIAASPFHPSNSHYIHILMLFVHLPKDLPSSLFPLLCIEQFLMCVFALYGNINCGARRVQISTCFAFLSLSLSLSLNIYIYIYKGLSWWRQVPHPVFPVNTVNTYSHLILLLVTKLHKELPRIDYQFMTHNKLNQCAVKFRGFLTVRTAFSFLLFHTHVQHNKLAQPTPVFDTIRDNIQGVSRL